MGTWTEPGRLEVGPSNWWLRVVLPRVLMAGVVMLIVLSITYVAARTFDDDNRHCESPRGCPQRDNMFPGDD